MNVGAIFKELLRFNKNVTYDKETNEVKGKIKMESNKPYFAFEIREDKKFRM